jgi:hypothetical protein
VFVTSQGSARTCFRRAIATGNLFFAELAAREMRERLPLDDALDLLFLFAAEKPERLPAAVLRWHGRLELEAATLTVEEAQLALAVLAYLPGGGEEASAAAAPAAGCEADAVAPDALVRQAFARLDPHDYSSPSPTPASTASFNSFRGSAAPITPARLPSRTFAQRSARRSIRGRRSFRNLAHALRQPLTFRLSWAPVRPARSKASSLTAKPPSSVLSHSARRVSSTELSAS